MCAFSVLSQRGLRLEVMIGDIVSIALARCGALSSAGLKEMFLL